MSAIEDWLKKHGLSALQTGLQVGGRLVDARQNREVAANNAAVSKFNRRLDIFNLAIHKKHLEYDQRITQRLAQESLADAQQAQRQIDFYGTEAGYRQLQLGNREWLTQSRIRELEQVTRRELDTQWLQLTTRNIALQGERAVRAKQQAQLAVEQDALVASERAALGTIGAGRGRVGAERLAQRMESTAARGVVGAGRRELALESLAIQEVGGIRGRARAEQLRAEVGAGIAGGAARGMRGSFRQVAAAKALVDFARDEKIRSLEDGLKQADVAERFARLAHTEAQVGAGDLRARARLDEEAARLTEAQVRVETEGAVGRARFDVRGTELAAAERTGEAQRRAALQERITHRARQEFLGERVERERRAGAEEAGGLSLQQAQARLQQFAARRVKAKDEIEAQKQTYEVWLGTMAKQLTDWKLKSLPALPDYEGMGTRTALSMAIRTAADLID